ncbi:MAG: hypothetical protein AB1640_21000 [bacterium]
MTQRYLGMVKRLGTVLLATAALIGLVILISPILSLVLDVFFKVFMKG